MNTLVQQFSQILGMTLDLRHQLVDHLTDADLAYRLPGANVTLGALCREMGEVEHAYAESFRTFRMDFSYRHPDASVETSVASLRQWYQALEAGLMAALSALSEEDLRQKKIDRGPYFQPTPAVQFHTYREALLIFYARVSLYLKGMNKPYPAEQWQYWIG